MWEWGEEWGEGGGEEEEWQRGGAERKVGAQVLSPSLGLCFIAQAEACGLSARASAQFCWERRGGRGEG